MAPRRPDKKSKTRGKGGMSQAATGEDSKPIAPQVLVKAAEHQLSEGNIQDAVTLAGRALEGAAPGSEDALAALNLAGQINLELGDMDTAREMFVRAAAIDPEGTMTEAVGGGPEKFLCLAQLSEEGGQDSVAWFEKGAAALKAQIAKREEEAQRRTNSSNKDAIQAELTELKKKLAMTLCSVAEVYMTDLSWEPDAEQRCEALTTEATLVAPDFAETWQTLASVRISQERIEDARAALTRSLELWKDLPPEHPAVPDFPSRIALARLLMEVGQETEALEVLERLVADDDQSVETWYLGGWGLYVSGEKLREKKSQSQDGEKGKENKKEDDTGEEDWKAAWISSRVWLNQCLHLYALQEYEDERLGEHAKELLAAIAKELGEAPAGEGEDDGDEGDDWEDEDDSDEEMKG
ncbi:TPR domain-containing protein [Xylariomycetidae sp. FL0641]|nr:TPR domain-containing protein [Xylariomycetidae sp. FL0641]KAI0025332.1 TPR domain-containing protein [Xylariomycetidae sp. FL0641]